ncbi:MAG: cellulose synthase operon protein YhjQ/BcsQ [Alphaproteobacteria bacterium]
MAARLTLLAFLRDTAAAEAARSAMAGRSAEVREGDVADAVKYLADHPSPEFLLVELPSAEAAPQLLDALADVVGAQTKVIAAGKVDTLSFYQWLVALGIHDYLLEPFTPAQLSASLAKGTQPAASAQAAPAERKLIAVIGARGGVGTTTVATHLAAISAVEHGLATALLDLDPHFGSVALGLDLEPGRGLRDALEKPDRIDALFLERVMVRPFDRLSILSAEEPLSEQIAAQPNAGEQLLAALGTQFSAVIADLPRQINPLTRYVLASADATVLVLERNLLNLRDALRIKDYIVDTLRRPAPLIVVNRAGLAPKHELAKGDFTKHYGAAEITELPYALEAFAAVNRGETLLENAKAKPLADKLRGLAARLLGSEATTEKPEKAEGLLGFLKGK